MTIAAQPWSVPVRLGEIPEAGKHVTLEANVETRAGMAMPVGVDAIERLAATFDLTPRGRDGLYVAGRVTAAVRQTCVVTLEPVVNEIDEVVEVTFAPPAEVAELDQEAAPGVMSDRPEPLVDGIVDLGALATEFLILGVDPHPRKPGAAFAVPEAADPSGHPFAALAALTKKAKTQE